MHVENNVIKNRHRTNFEKNHFSNKNSNIQIDNKIEEDMSKPSNDPVTSFKSLYDTYLTEFLIICTTHSCTIVFGNTVFIASGKPFNP